jgi:hypothetical protein
MKYVPSFLCPLVNLGLQLDLLFQTIDHNLLAPFTKNFTTAINSKTRKKHIKRRYFDPVYFFIINPILRIISSQVFNISHFVLIKHPQICNTYMNNVILTCVIV